MKLGEISRYASSTTFQIEIMKHYLYLFLIAFAVVSITSCDDDDPDMENEEELITTLILTFTPTDGGAPLQQIFRDLDGDGGNEPIISTVPLGADTDYVLDIRVLNEAEDPTEDITEEIEAEDDEHQFFFEISGLNLTIEYADADGDGNPIGLENDAVTTTVSTGSLTVTLRHEPDKDGEGVASGDITNAGGETDIEVTFNMEIIQ